MATVQPRYNQDDFARRGDELYESRIRQLVEPARNGQFVAIDIETGQFEVDPDELTAIDRLRARLPGAQIWLRRIGSRYLHRYGPRSSR